MKEFDLGSLTPELTTPPKIDTQNQKKTAAIEQKARKPHEFGTTCSDIKGSNHVTDRIIRVSRGIEEEYGRGAAKPALP